MIKEQMFDRLAIIVIGNSNSGKTSTLKEYVEYYKNDGIITFRKGWRHGLSPYKPKFYTVKISAYVLPKSPSEDIPLHESIEPLEWYPDVLLLPEQPNGKEFVNTINYLRLHRYHIKQFILSDIVGIGTWDRWTKPGEETTRLLYRREEIADYIRNFINSRI